MKKLAIAAAAILAAGPAMAHTGHGSTSGLVAGLTHPVFGLDHLLAMVAVGLWSGFALPQRVWAGAVAFLAAMAAGAGLSWAGVAVPMVETWITLSVLVFGLLTVFARPQQSPMASGLTLAAIAGFAACHGHAHATEASGNAVLYLAGFLAATAGLHLVGIALARSVASGRFARLLQGGMGLAVSAGGLALIAG
ncbi:HupE/UreJ family protein [Phaeobacter gallaeciensis]|uniref:HupE/UreJ family protein n=1 Tax=Phaeobacter gallaeciensis TaxID=60890 RepID=UPI00237F4A43|nr:HupE/UreJ family protein [Phaeobacter gallaeciensis]MDE4100004.1 HupE/UreJ family protein [Phaeobacter gallaeciensis]MDE4108804.1 HupE/UreJ family protein [Phaeobacter gallaeciensis]MDE4113250.1 HupE/UreJ family protein [Phaeobacter gallaeciensis]MDE4117691.1 HupE/UreJ family protein [Phaeobacter gallaeciensis]MDE4122194.1 HupE/UreJ family protein [Phaeobacter gallaeciensis]